MKTPLTIAAVFAFAAGAANAATHEVHMLNKGEAGLMVFEPAFVSAEPGDVIHFVSVDKGHNAESIEGMLPEGVEAFKSKPNEDFDLTVSEEGVYGVKCTPHYGMGMVALIKVGEPVNLDGAAAVKQRGKAKGRMADLIAQVE
ncbi:pseudoazurin [Tropicimonas isoalkanivorans]|uniref:Pseudoazurin n=1 Tax=Tropicimonas isoalkanivorans TaxID=441112 RepID=A0A1I1HN33_9RHOB|nr:pseudoazurin [Tropicimonas isoalkanivorans]SFC24972.1 pseudoazurin [Tropicimonas isoalkanivorans]